MGCSTLEVELRASRARTLVACAQRGGYGDAPCAHIVLRTHHVGDTRQLERMHAYTRVIA